MGITSEHRRGQFIETQPRPQSYEPLGGFFFGPDGIGWSALARYFATGCCTCSFFNLLRCAYATCGQHPCLPSWQTTPKKTPLKPSYPFNNQKNRLQDCSDVVGRWSVITARTCLPTI